MSVLTSIWFMKVHYQTMDKAQEWLKGHHFPIKSLINKGTYWEYVIRPMKGLDIKSRRTEKVGDIMFVYANPSFQKYKKEKKGKKAHSLHPTKEGAKLHPQLKAFAGLIAKAVRAGKTTHVATPKPIVSTIGKVVGSGHSFTQSVRIPKKWGMEKSKEWLRKNDYKTSYDNKSPYTTTENWNRFRQFPVRKNADYKIKKLSNGVQLALEFKGYR